jgi:carbon storage regulator
MLVLSRKLNEKILVDDNVIITLLEIKGGRVRIGISAPTETTVLRGELSSRPKPQRGLSGKLPLNRRASRSVPACADGT